MAQLDASDQATEKKTCDPQPARGLLASPHSDITASCPEPLPSAQTHLNQLPSHRQDMVLVRLFLHGVDSHAHPKLVSRCLFY